MYKAAFLCVSKNFFSLKETKTIARMTTVDSVNNFVNCRLENLQQWRDVLIVLMG